jgi:hypothetical protein
LFKQGILEKGCFLRIPASDVAGVAATAAVIATIAF